METHEKVFTVKTSEGNYYVQRMVDEYTGHSTYRLMHDRRCLYYRYNGTNDYDEMRDAIRHLLYHLQQKYSPGLFDKNNK